MPQPPRRPAGCTAGLCLGAAAVPGSATGAVLHASSAPRSSAPAGAERPACYVGQALAEGRVARVLQAQAHTIDGILLTKFDTIDDKARPACPSHRCCGARVVESTCVLSYGALAVCNKGLAVQLQACQLGMRAVCCAMPGPHRHM